jgi:hypothetical protein
MPTRFRASATVLRLLGSAAMVFGIFLAFPAETKAQGHGVSIFKTCVSPKTSCNTDQDCSDPNSCTGFGVCTSSGAGHMNQCSITLVNSDPSLDNITVLSDSDTVFAFAGNQTFSDLPVSGTTGTTSGDCVAPINPATGCTLAPNASITFLSNQYTIQAADPNPLVDQGAVLVRDECNINPSGCSMVPNNVQFTASTTLVSGCTPGAPCTPTATPTNAPTNTPTAPNTPTNTPVNTPTNTPPQVAPPPVPTLSFPMMALLGLLLAGAGLFLARRH